MSGHPYPLDVTEVELANSFEEVKDIKVIHKTEFDYL